jgi:hypothetical protein
MPRILISYRREDSAAYAGRLFDRLSDYFGPDSIFIDIDTIKPGQDFIQTIEKSVILCDVVLAVIGTRWLAIKDATGQRRLDRPDDLVRIEVASALNRGIQVIPVLVGGAEMPTAADLPNDLLKLARLQALEISDGRFHHDVHQLIQALGGSKSKASAAGGPTWSGVARSAVGRFVARWQWGLGALALVLLLWAAYRQLPIGRRVGVGPPSASTAAESPVQSARPLSAPGTARVAESGAAGGISVASEDGFELVQGAPPPVRPLQALGTIDTPQPIDLGVTYKFMLDDVETAYLSIPVAVTGLLMIVDMRPTRPQTTNLQSRLSVLDRDGGVLEARAISFNEIDRGYRRMGAIAVKQQSPIGLKLLNGGKPITYWLTVFNTARIPFVPFFGDVTPRPLRVAETASGTLDAGEDVYFTIALKKGSYRAFLDFTNAPRDNTNIQGYLAILDAAGGSQEKVIRLNEIDVAFRKIGGVTIKRDGTAIVRIQTVKPVKYNLRIAPDEGSS